MNDDQVKSDQLYYWSDSDVQPTRLIFATTTQGPAATLAELRAHPARLSDPALQAVWQTRVQVCHRTRPRAQVLLVDQPYRRQAADGLCAPAIPRPGRTISGQLPIVATDPRGDLQPQPGTLTPQRAIVEARHGRRSHITTAAIRGHRPDRSPGGQHAPSTAKPRSGPFIDHGGKP